MANLSKVDLDPKGYAVLAGGKGYALVFRGEKAIEPFVIASGYDPDTGEWSSGTYFTDLGHAWERFQDDILEEASVRWVDEDFRLALRQAGAPVTDENVEELKDRVDDMRGWRDRAISMGNEMIVEEAFEFARVPRKAVNIAWDTDGLDEGELQIPNEMRIPDELCGEEEISDWLTESTGFCNKGFEVVAASKSYIEARMMNEHGEEVEGYFWYTDDVRYALHETLERANEENVGYEHGQLLFHDDSGNETLVAEFRSGDETVYHEYADGRS